MGVGRSRSKNPTERFGFCPAGTAPNPASRGGRPGRGKSVAKLHCTQKVGLRHHQRSRSGEACRSNISDRIADGGSIEYAAQPPRITVSRTNGRRDTRIPTRGPKLLQVGVKSLTWHAVSAGKRHDARSARDRIDRRQIERVLQIAIHTARQFSFPRIPRFTVSRSVTRQSSCTYRPNTHARDVICQKHSRSPS